MKNLLFILLPFCLLYCNSKHTSKSSSVETNISEVEIAQKLLYISSRAEGFDIYLSDEDGNNEVLLTKANKGMDWGPKWNESLQAIIYNSQDTAKQFTIKAMDLDGKPKAINTNGLEEYQLSPDGRYLVFSQSVGDFRNLYLRPLDNLSDSVAVTDEESYNGRPKWSPNSDNLLFVSDRTGLNELYIYNLTDKTTTQLTNNSTREKYTDWSPNGQQIAFTVEMENGKEDIFIISKDKSNLEQLTNTEFGEEEINWSPKGDKIAYHAKIDGKDDIFTIEIKTRTITKITNGEGYHGEPEWVPIRAK